MNQHTLLKTVFTLLIPSIAGFSTTPGLAFFQSPVPSFQNQQATISQSSSTAITSPTLLQKPFLISGGGGSILAPTAVNCNTTSEAVVQTPEGFISVSDYCQAQFNNRQQSEANIQAIQQPWQEPYWLKDNVCRERGADIVCLAPQEAINLKWLTPSR